MRCSKCNAENPSGKKFCAECGGALEGRVRCRKCDADNPVESKFCGDCGSALGSQAPGDAEDSQRDGERRHLTILFCDLVGSTGMQHRLDPEEAREIVAGYQRAVAEAIGRFGGHVAKYLGDGVMAYFGYPQAHEDDAERAVRAGLAIVDVIARQNDGVAGEQRGIKLAVRVGIHSGSVVVGRGGGREADVFGDTPNIASRVQTVAEPDTVVMTPPVYRLTSGLFVVEDCGLRALKGIERPISLYRAIQPSVARRRTRGAAARALTPFVGRDAEIRLLLSRWERSCEGEGQLVLVVGEAGIGKSRLIEEFRARIKPHPHLWIECGGERFFESAPFHAVTQMLNQGLGWRGDESKEERVVQIERSLELSGVKLGETLPLIAEMLNLPVPEKYPPPMFAPNQKRKRLLAALAAWVFGATRAQPLVIALEDLHWVDPSTLELLHTLVEQAATAQLMLLFTVRPEFRAPWLMRAHHAQITLNRLNERQTREMVAGVAAQSALTKDVIDTIVIRTDGVPLFAEELTRLILDGDVRSAARDIPATLHDSLTARLDRLGEAKEVAQVAAVIGREFSYELLQAVLPIAEGELQSALAKLADAELIYARGIPPEATYQFKHALIQDAAYEALLKTKRRELHRRVAQTVTERFAPIAEEQPQTLARHWAGAGETMLAIAAWKKAADAAYARRAFKEAEEGYRQALAMVNTLSESPERDALELEFASALVGALFITKGYTASESVESAARAATLAEKTGNLASLILQAFGTWGAVYASDDLLRSAALANQLLDLANREGSSTSLAFAHNAQVLSRYNSGDLVGVEKHFGRLNLYCDEPLYQQFVGAHILALSYAALAAFRLGHIDSAFDRMAQAVAAAQGRNNPYELALVRFFEAMMYQDLRDRHRAEAVSVEALAIADEHGFPVPRNLALINLGWTRAHLGRAAEGVALIREGLAGLAAIGARLGFPLYLTYLAEAQKLDGAKDDALTTIEDALQANPDELIYVPETLRCRGALRLELGLAELAEADFREAIAAAQRMTAKLLELRATTNLARLMRDTYRRDEACAMLAETYGWFTAGFDTADLMDAKALLDELVGAAEV